MQWKWFWRDKTKTKTSEVAKKFRKLFQVKLIKLKLHTTTSMTYDQQTYLKIINGKVFMGQTVSMMWLYVADSSKSTELYGSKIDLHLEQFNHNLWSNYEHLMKHNSVKYKLKKKKRVLLNVSWKLNSWSWMCINKYKQQNYQETRWITRSESRKTHRNKG